MVALVPVWYQPEVSFGNFTLWADKPSVAPVNAKMFPYSGSTKNVPDMTWSRANYIFVFDRRCMVMPAMLKLALPGTRPQYRPSIDLNIWNQIKSKYGARSNDGGLYWSVIKPTRVLCGDFVGGEGYLQLGLRMQDFIVFWHLQNSPSYAGVLSARHSTIQPRSQGPLSSSLERGPWERGCQRSCSTNVRRDYLWVTTQRSE